MMHNFIGLIYFSIKQLKFEQKYQSLKSSGICITKNENEVWQQVLRNRQFNRDEDPNKNEKKQEPSENDVHMNHRPSEEQEHDMWGVLYTQKDYDMSNQYKKIDKRRKITINRLCEILCQQYTTFEVKLFSEINNQFLAICSFPLDKIQKIPKIKHELEIQLVSYQTYNQMNQQVDVDGMFGQEQQQPNHEKHFLTEFKQQFQNQLNQHKILKNKKHERIAKMTINMVFTDRNYGKLIFQAIEVCPKPSVRNLAQLMQPQLIIRIDNREVRTQTYKIIKQMKVIWYKVITFEIDRIPTKISITLFNKESEEEEGVANMPVFISSLLLPTKRTKKQTLKMFDSNSEDQGSKLIGDVVVKHRFVPNAI